MVWLKAEKISSPFISSLSTGDAHGRGAKLRCMWAEGTQKHVVVARMPHSQLKLRSSSLQRTFLPACMNVCVASFNYVTPAVVAVLLSAMMSLICQHRVIML